MAMMDTFLTAKPFASPLEKVLDALSRMMSPVEIAPASETDMPAADAGEVGTSQNDLTERAEREIGLDVPYADYIYYSMLGHGPW